MCARPPRDRRGSGGRLTRSRCGGWRCAAGGGGGGEGERLPVRGAGIVRRRAHTHTHTPRGRRLPGCSRPRTVRRKEGATEHAVAERGVRRRAVRRRGCPCAGARPAGKTARTHLLAVTNRCSAGRHTQGRTARVQALARGWVALRSRRPACRILLPPSHVMRVPPSDVPHRP